MLRAVVVAATLLFLITASPGGERVVATVKGNRSFTLESAIALGLAQNPDVLKAIHEIERTRGQVIEVRAAALPSLTATGSYTQYDPRLIQSGGVVSASSSTTSSTSTLPTSSDTSALSSSASTTSGSSALLGGNQDKSYRITLQVQQTIYSGGKVRAAWKIAALAEDSSHQILRETVASTIAKVRTQFFTALLNRELIPVAEESIVLLTDQLKDQQNRFDAGTVPRFNVLQAEVELANARPDLIRAKNNFHIARLELGKTLGLETNEEPDVIGYLRMPPREVNLARALAAALQNRSILKAQKDTVLTEEQQITVARAGYKPTLSADAGYEFLNARGTSDLAKVTNGWFFGVNGSWAIFDGLKTKGQIDQAKARLASAKVSLTDSEQQVELEVEKAYAQAKVSREVIASQSKVVEQAIEALRLSRERLSAGAGTQLDVLNARVALTKARTTQKQALSDYNVALAEYDRATGADTIFDPTVPELKARPSDGPVRRPGVLFNKE